MKTDELIKLLSTGVEPVQPYSAEKFIAQALLAGTALSFVLMLVFYGIRPDLGEVSSSVAFMMKLGIPLGNIMIAVGFLRVLAQPGKSPKAGYWLLFVPILILWGWALWSWSMAEPGQQAELLWGKTWRGCILHITFLTIPIAVAVFFALRNLAPTKPALTGAIAGWLAGSTGASVYALHCPEMGAPFIAVWYVLGMLLSTAIMAYVGYRGLRW